MERTRRWSSSRPIKPRVRLEREVRGEGGEERKEDGPCKDAASKDEADADYEPVPEVGRAEFLARLVGCIWKVTEEDGGKGMDRGEEGAQ